MKKLENLLNFKDFNSNWQQPKGSKTKRTEVAKDILKENVEEIIPEGLPEEVEERGVSGLMGSGKNMWQSENHIDEITKLVKDLDEGFLDEVINYLRDVLTDMEHQGFITEDETDELDDRHDAIDKEWVIDVINLQEIPEDALIGVLDIISGGEVGVEFNDEDDEFDDEL